MNTAAERVAKRVDEAGLQEAVATVVSGRAEQFESDQALPRSVMDAMARQGWLGAMIPAEFDGAPLEPLALGWLCGALARESGSLLSLMTVHTMVGFGIARWGSAEQCRQWLPQLASGKVIGAFALTEPEVGSDAKSVKSTLRREGDQLVLNGGKKWISLAQVAGLFLVAAQLEGRLVAILVPSDTPGLAIRPIRDMYGFRAAMLGELAFEECRLPSANLIGNVAFGLAQIVGSVLDQGRYCIAWGAVGLAQACLDASLEYARTRCQFGQPIGEHQLIQAMISDMMVNSRAARLMCEEAAALRASADPQMLAATMGAKYFAGTVAERIASDALQLHGANGFSADFPVQRYLRDAKVLNVIEGSTQIQQVLLARHGLKLQA